MTSGLVALISSKGVPPVSSKSLGCAAPLETGAVGDAPVLLGEADRHDAQCQEDVLVGPRQGGDLGDALGNLGGAVDVLDRDGLSGGAG